MKESTNVTGNFVRLLFLDYNKALLNKMVGMEVPAHLVRWMAAFLLDREQSKSRRRCIKTRVSQKWRSPGDFIRAKTFFYPYQ